MKTLKRLVFGIIIILIISVCVKCFLVPWLNVRGKQSLDLYYYQSKLVDEDRDLYALILKGVSEQDAVIKLPAKTENKMEEITQMILCDHPEIFWIDGSYQYTSYDDKIELEFNYLYEKKEVSGRRKEIQKAASAFTELLSDADTEYDIIQKAYLYVIDTVEYEANSSDNQNVYSSLVNHKSVCAGYAKAIQYLLQQNGIQALYVSGVADGTGGWDDHAWNIVRCEGRYYQVDATFGDGYTNPDERMEKLGIHNFAYLCIDDNTMYRNHKVSGKMKVPECNSTDMNYFYRNSFFSDHYDEQVNSCMRDIVFSGQSTWCYQFSNKDAYMECLLDIQNGTYSMLVSEYLDDSCQISYIYDDAMYYILCWY